MTTPRSPSHPSRPLLTKAASLYLVFVIYGSLVPLRFVDRSWEDAVDAFQRIPFLDLGIQSRADWVANFLLFIPLTFLAGMLFNRAGGYARRVAVAVGLVASAACLATGIEFTQLFFPQRTVSQNDILAEGLGGLVGALSHVQWGARAQAWLDDLLQAGWAQDRTNILLRNYLIFLLLFNILPLDLTLSPVEIFHKWKEGRLIFVPFSGHAHGGATAMYEILTDMVVWLPVGMLWAWNGGRTLTRIGQQGLLAALCIEVLQLFVYSRTTDVTDVLLGGAGTLVGALLWRRLYPWWPSVAQHLRRWGWVWWGVWSVFLAGVFWFPFEFRWELFNSTNAITAFTRLPFYTYYYGSEFHAVNELLRKVSFFLPAGMILGSMATLHTSSTSARTRTHLLVLGMLAGVIEFGQLALPGKVADLTDAALEFAGAWMGYRAMRWVLSADVVDGARTSRRAVASERAVRTLPKSKRGCDGVDAWKGHLIVLVAGVLSAGVVLTSSAVPYNVRELIPSGIAGAWAVVALVILVYALSNATFLLDALAGPQRWGMVLPVYLVGHALISWVLLRTSVPLESLHDIIGAPTWQWPWEWELLLRYAALHISVLLLVMGGCLLVQCVLVPNHLPRFLLWAVFSFLLSWPLYTVVVSWAATDNLTELIAYQAGWGAASILAVAMCLTGVAGSALSALLSVRSQRGVLVLVAMGAAGLASFGYVWGTEEFIVKYGKVFSAMQFLLSTDREHYAQGMGLMIRFACAMALLCGALAASQWLSWRAFAFQARSASRRDGRKSR